MKSSSDFPPDLKRDMPIVAINTRSLAVGFRVSIVVVYVVMFSSCLVVVTGLEAGLIARSWKKVSQHREDIHSFCVQELLIDFNQTWIYTYSESSRRSTG